MTKKIHYFYQYIKIYITIVFLIILFVGGCSDIGKQEIKNLSIDLTVPLPSLVRILPNDPHLFLPLEDVGFKLTFTKDVDLDMVEQAISFTPEVNFIIESSNRHPKEVYLQPQEKLQADTGYTLQIKGVQNDTTGKIETLKFTYRTEFQDDKQITDIQWSNDGEEILYLVRSKKSNTTELWKVSFEDGNKQLLATELGWPGRANWAPDDSTILFTKMVFDSDKRLAVPDVRTVDRQGREEKVIVSAAELAEIAPFSPTNLYSWWSPDRKKIAMQIDMGHEDSHSDMYRSLALADSDGRNLRLIEGQLFLGWQKDNSLMVLKTHQSYNSNRAYRYNIFVINVDGKELSKLLLGEGQIFNFDQASQSFDFNTLVFSQWESISTVNGFKNEGTGLLLYNVSQNLLVPFGLEEGYQKHPAVSPDGKKIAFAANKDGNWNLYLQENGITTQLTRNSAHEIYPAWSPNEDILAFVSTQSGTEQIWVLELSSGKIEQLTGFDR